MDIALFVPRIVVGAFFIGHGSQKLYGAFGGHGLAGTAQFFESLGMRPGRVNARVAGIAELAAGVLLVLGLATPLAAALVVAVMAVAIVTVHARSGPWVTDGGYEYNVVLAAAAFALAGAGAGGWSLDAAAGWDVAGAGWALGAVAVGLLAAAGAIGRARSLQGRPERPEAAPAGASEEAATAAAADRAGRVVRPAGERARARSEEAGRSTR